jgi:hypothetical protein
LTLTPSQASLFQNFYLLILWRPNSELLVVQSSDRSWVFACEFSVSVIQKYLPQMYLLVYRRNNNDIFNFSALSCGFLAVFVSWRWVAEFSEHCSLVGTWCRKTAKQRKRKNMRILMDEKNCQRKL